jgi:transcriptional regulator with XRE-family HTH domain
MLAMKFAAMLDNFISSSKMNKTEVAIAINVSPQYVMNLCKGLTTAPTVDRCRQIATAISLSPAETQSLIDAAIEERLSPEETPKKRF